MRWLCCALACGCSTGPSLIAVQLQVAHEQHPLELTDQVTFTLSDASDRTLAVRRGSSASLDLSLDPVPAGHDYRLSLEGSFGGDSLARGISCRFDVPTASVPLYLGELGRFALTGAPAAARQAAVAFSDGGGALLVGGDSGQGPTATTESYGVATAKFSPSEPLNAARAGAVFATRGDGSTLVIGGAAVPPAVEAWQGGKWGPVLTVIPPSLSESAALSLGDGSVLVCGGRSRAGGAPIDSGWLLGGSDLGPQSPLITARARHSLTLASSDRSAAAFVIGGMGAAGLVADVEIFDPVTVSFAPLGSKLSTPRQAHSATRLQSGRILVTGGLDAAGMPLASAELLDPVARRFFDAAPLAVARSGHSATLLGNGNVLIAGGSDASGALSSVEIFDALLGGFVAAQPLQIARSGHSVVLLCDGTLLFVGGGVGAERYVP